MGTPIYEGIEPAFAVANNYDWDFTHVHCFVIAYAREFGFETQEVPRCTPEYRVLFLCMDLFVGVKGVGYSAEILWHPLFYGWHECVPRKPVRG
tara:strand:+ start:65 stop:346 length:282 start_codon:yes stop_codon:yes gene_type:complete